MTTETPPQSRLKTPIQHR